MHREVDIGLVLALLLGVADGDAFERIDAVHAVLAWRSRRQQVTEGAAALYVAALKVRQPSLQHPIPALSSFSSSAGIGALNLKRKRFSA